MLLIDFLDVIVAFLGLILFTVVPNMGSLWSEMYGPGMIYPTLLKPVLLVLIIRSSVCPLLWVGILKCCVRYLVNPVVHVQPGCLGHPRAFLYLQVLLYC